MKHLTTFLTMAITLTGLGQQMPYNPDANGDDFVGVDDVLGVLGVYDTALMQPDLQCDYEGTDLEEFIGDLFSSNIILDSLIVEYYFNEQFEAFIPGCPDPQIMEVVLNRSITMQGNSYLETYGNGTKLRLTSSYLGYQRELEFWFFDTGTYKLGYYDAEAGELTNYAVWSYTGFEPIPFPESWTLDSTGITVSWEGWSDDFANNCDSFRIIPFWHEAE